MFADSLLRPLRRQYCLLCHGKAAAAVCAGCLSDLQALAVDPHQVCPRCGGHGDGSTPCGRCQQTPPPFERLWSSLYYEVPLAGILHQYKHLRQPALARVLACVMAELPPPWPLPFDGILAVPLSAPRQLERGFNQCHELAALLASRYHLPLLPPHTVFRRPAPPQSTLPHRERQQNVRGGFSVRGDVKKRNLLLIDDVATTNATLAEISRELIRAGAVAVSCWTLAQAKVKRF